MFIPPCLTGWGSWRLTNRLVDSTWSRKQHKQHIRVTERHSRGTAGLGIRLQIQSIRLQIQSVSQRDRLIIPASCSSLKPECSSCPTLRQVQCFWYGLSEMIHLLLICLTHEVPGLIELSHHLLFERSSLMC